MSPPHEDKGKFIRRSHDCMLAMRQRDWASPEGFVCRLPFNLLANPTHWAHAKTSSAHHLAGRRLRETILSLSDIGASL
jgi:hypothetical protein